MDKDIKQINSLGIFGSIINGTLFLLKITVGMLSGSLAITSDAFNNLSDFLNTMITYFALKFSLKPADEDHPYGHERFEIIAGFTVSMIMLLVAFESIKTGLVGLFVESGTEISSLVVKVSMVAIVLKLILMFVYRHFSKVLDSSLLKTNEFDSLFDVLISCSLILAYYIQPYVGFNLDALIGFIIGVIILVTAAFLLRDFISGLLGRKASDEEIQGILNVLDDNNDIEGYHDLSIHSYGKFHKYALVHVEVNELMSLIQAHQIVDDIEDEVLAQTGIVLDVHLDPLDVSSPEIKDVIRSLKKVFSKLGNLVDFHEVRIHESHVHLEVFNPPESLISNDSILLQVQAAITNYEVKIDFEYINLIQDYKESQK